MIPAFDKSTGFLPVGRHETTWTEFVERFGTTQQRRDLISGLLRAIHDLKSCGCSVVYIDGGFTTNKTAPPKDIDVCWDKAGVDLFKLSFEHEIFFQDSERQKRKYDCEFFCASQMEGRTGKPFLDFFQQYYGIPKGILQISIIDL